jgi:glucose/arabinose dehydrogenase
MRAAWLALALALVPATPAHAAPELVKAGDFEAPTYATAAPGDASRIFVTEQPGRVRLIRDGVVRPQPFLDVSAITQTGGERGLLSAAFAPDYATSGRFYVYLTATAAASASGAGELQVREYRRSAANPDVADPATARILLAIPHNEAGNHNGGQLQFGPDGKLWLATGDGGTGGAHAQDEASLLGKLLRIDAAAPGAVGEVVGRGLRNPWRFSFDRATGQIMIADVGENAFEEVDVGAPVGTDFGWPCWEGTSSRSTDPDCATGTTFAVVQKSHSSDGFCAIVGGYVVRDPGLPTLAGRYVYGDNCATGLRSVDLANPAADAAVGLTVPALSSFGEDSCGRILVVSLSGPVYRPSTARRRRACRPRRPSHRRPRPRWRLTPARARCGRA